MAENPYPGRIKVKVTLDVKFGEVYFEIDGSPISRNKCLFDLLSQYGLKLERSKPIVADLAKSIDMNKFYHLEPIDYVKYGRERRSETEA